MNRVSLASGRSVDERADGTLAWLCLFVIVLVAMASSCSSSSPQRSMDLTAPYLGHPDREWELLSAVDPEPTSVALKAEPSLRWWAEYENFPESLPGEGRSVRLSEHTGDMEALLASQPGLSGEPAQVGSFDALAVTSPDGVTEVMFEVSKDRTVMVLSYQLGVDELRAWAEELEPLTARGWIARGGTIDD